MQVAPVTHTFVGNPLLEAWEMLEPDRERSFLMTEFKADRGRFMEAAELLGVADDEALAELFSRPLPPMVLGSVLGHAIRQKAVRKWAWAIPSTHALDLIAEHGPLVELFAGAGYWAALLLAQRGVDVVAYDATPPSLTENHWHDPVGFFPVRQADYTVAGHHPDRALFVCWPPLHQDKEYRYSEPDDDLDAWTRSGTDEHPMWVRPTADADPSGDALELYTDAGGRTVIYIGEGAGGCTGSDRFHALLGNGCSHYGDVSCSCPEPAWEAVAYLGLPQWPGLHDDLHVYRRV